MLNRSRIVSTCALLSTAAVGGCARWVIDDSDRHVYEVIRQRQLDALGETHDVHVGAESGRHDRNEDMYRFVPSPVGAEVPQAFLVERPSPDAAVTPAPQEPVGGAPVDDDAASGVVPDDGAEAEPPGDAAPAGEPPPGGEPAGGPPPVVGGEGESDQAAEAESQPDAAAEGAEEPCEYIDETLVVQGGRTMGLVDALAYATRQARDLQDAKEDLYLAALDLTLERHLWTPQFVASVRAEFADYGQIRDFDRAMTTVSQVAVAQRLPFGGEVTARVISTLMRDLGVHTTSGESGSMIVDANIPLFRGAGRVAYESRYRREREMIYSVRAYERFRRQFLVNVAVNYFTLQQNRSRIINAVKNYNAACDSARRSVARFELGQEELFEKARTQATLRQAATDVEDEKEAYESSLDQFKILLGMPVAERIDVVSQDDDRESRLLEFLLPEVDEELAIEVALKSRLDLLTTHDQIDDARRGVVIARNGLLPDLNLTASATLNSDPDQLNSLSFNTERTTWRGAVELSMDDRKTERNAYRAALIDQRRAERRYDEAADQVRSDVRRAVRRIAQSQSNREIQQLNVDENEIRLDAARRFVRLGLRTNQDEVDAQNDLQRARNALAAAEAGVRRAILEFRLNTETLRVSDDGELMSEQMFTGP
ncbi:MAG: TolC family protein [Phycisphaerales bacterium]|nr:MAG: TolC family protein [Phycisphaerales bacterium]